MVDLVLTHVADHCSVLICDGEGCNQLIRAAVHGTLEATVRRRLGETDFLQHVQLSSVAGLEEMPHCPIKACHVNGSPFFMLPGPAHACKNSASQLMAESKCLYFGDHPADMAQALSLDLPIPGILQEGPHE